MLRNELPKKYNCTQFPLCNSLQKYITFSLDESWLLANLLYHVSGVYNCFHLTINVNLLQLKNTHISDILVFMHTFLEDSPTHWHHSLILRHVSENSRYTNSAILVFSTYSSKISHLTLLSLYMVKHYWSFCYCWHIHLMSIKGVKIQTRFMVLFTSGSLLTWGNL